MPNSADKGNEGEARRFPRIAGMKLSPDYAELVKFIFSTGWQAHFDAVLTEHFGAAMEHFDLDDAGISETIGDKWTAALWMCSLDDLASRVIKLEKDGDRQLNLVDDFLNRNRKLPGPVECYLRVLQTSIMSLYEVIDARPDVSLVIRDLVRGGEPVLVAHHCEDVALARGDRVGARVILIAGRNVLASNVLKYSRDGSEALLRGLQMNENRMLPTARLSISDDHLRELGHLFSIAWLSDFVPKATGKRMPVLFNTVGHKILFHCIRFPLLPGTVRAAIAAKLAAVPGVNREDDSSWVWLGPTPVGLPLPRARQWSLPPPYSFTKNGAPVFGYIELVATELIVFVISAKRARRATASFGKLLGDLAGAPSIVIETMDQACAGSARDKQV